MKRWGATTGLAVGIYLGAVAAPKWRVIVKEGIKATIGANLKLREVSARAMEEFSDMAQEARWEWACAAGSASDAGGDAAPVGGRAHSGPRVSSAAGPAD
ncbi:MAG: hypothetical protein ACRDX8_03250 [Acidimicrobiales bacterium]